MTPKKLTTLCLSQNKDYIIGLEAAAQSDMITAAEKFRSLAHRASHVIPALITPLLRLATQSDQSKNIQLLVADLFSICGWYTEAIQELEDIIEQYPEETTAYQLLGKIWSRAPRHTEIEAIFENAIDNGIFDSAILDILPKMYIGQYEYEKSVSLYKKLVERDPSAIHLQQALASMLSRCNRYEEAIDTFEHIITASPLHAANIASQLEEMVTTAPNNIRLRETLFRTLCKICHPDEAVHHVDAILDWHPTEASRVIGLLTNAKDLFPDLHIIYRTLARALILNQQYSEALDHLNRLFQCPNKDYLVEITEMASQILELYPAQVLAMQLLSDISVFQADYNQALNYLEQMIQYDLQEFESVEIRLDHIATTLPNLAHRCHYLRAKLRLAQRRFDQVIVECQMLTGTDYDILSKQLMATAYEHKTDFEKSESTLFSALHIAPFSTELHHQLRGLKQRLTEGIISEQRHSQEISLKLGVAYLIQGDYYLALEHLQKINTSHNEYAQSQLLISRCFLDLGRYDQSLNHSNRLINNDIPSPTDTTNQARFLASTCYFSLGDINRCIETLESILEYDITFQGIQPILKLLRQESLMAYRIKAVSGCYTPTQQLIISSVRNTEVSSNQTISFAHPHNNAGVDYLFKHQLKAAEDEFKIALQMDPNLSVAYCNFAILKLMQHQKESALSLIKTAEGINPHFELIHLIRGLIASSENNLIEAEAQFQAAYSLRADHFITLLNLGDTYYQRGEYDPAFRYWKDASELAPISHLMQRRIGYLIPMTHYWSTWSNGIEIPIIPPTQ